MPVDKLSIVDFAQSIKQKYPQYKDMPDSDLANKVITKYPQYKDRIKTEEPAQPAPATQPAPEQPKSEMMSADISQYTNVKAPSEKQPVSVPSTEMPDYEGAANRTVKNINDHLDKTLLKINNNATDRAFKEVVQKHKLGEINDEEYNKAQSAYLGEVLINKDQRLAEAKDLMNQDPQYKAKVIQKIADDNPKIAKELKADNYILEAQKRPHDPFLVAANAHEIKRGQLDFSIEHGQLTKNLDFAQSIGAAYNQRNKTLDDFDFYNNATPEDAIKHLDEKLSEYHPDKPVDVPGPVGGAIGSQGMLMAKGAGTAVGVSLLGAPEAAPWAAAAAVSPEIYKTSYTNALERNYADILSNNPNISKQDAYKQADERAVFEAKADVAAGVAMSVAGGRIGLKGFKPRELSPGFIKVTENIANHVAQTGVEGGVAATAAGGAEVLKNIHNEKPIGENVGEAVKGQLLLAYGMGLLTHAGSKLISPKTRQMVLQNVAKLPEDVANKTLGDLVSTGKVSPEEANDIHTEVKTQRENDLKIPSSVKSDAARADIHKMLQKREDLEVRLENQSKAFAPETKEKITALDEKINETAKNGKQHDEDTKVELPFPKAEEKPSVSVIRPEENKQPNVVPLKSEGLPDIYKNMAEKDPEGFKTFIKDQIASGNQAEVESIPGIEPYINEIKTQENAQAVRSNQRQLSEEGGIPEGSQDNGGKNIQQPSPQTSGHGETVEQTGEEGKTPGEKEKVNSLESITGKPAETIGITHERMNELSRELGIPEYEESPETIAAWDKEADARIAKDPQAISKLLNKMRSGNMPDHVEQRMVLKYVSDLKARWNESKSDELLTQIKRVKDLSNVVGGRAVGKSLRARQDEIPVEKTLPDYMIREMEAYGVDHLTEGQKKQATKDYENISGSEEDYKTKYEKLAAQVAKDKAETEFNKAKAARKPTEKKTKEDYAAERKSIIEEYKKKKESDTTKRQGAPITDEDVKLVAKLLKSYVEEGVDNLKEAVSKIHETVKDAIEGISEKDIHNIIAGEYAAKKENRSEVLAKMVDLKNEAKLINKIENIQSGEPTTEKAKIKKNQALTELQSKIHELTKDEKSLKTIKSRNEAELKRVKEQIDKGNFEPDKKKPSALENEEIAKKYPELYRQALEAKTKLVKLKQDREVRFIKQQFERKNKYEKFGHYAVEALNTPRTLMSSVDFSAPLRQGLIPTIAHPDLAVRAAGLMFKTAFSQEAFDKWFYQLRDSPEFDIMKKSNLYVADPHDYRLTAREEAYMSNLAERIPIIGALVKGSERAYVAYLNKMRVDMFNRGADILSSEGHTIKNSKEEYEALASWVNNATGRGGLNNTLQNAAPLLNATFFSPRLIASRLNLLNPYYYYKLPKNIRVSALKDMAKFIGFGLTVLYASHAAGAEVEVDPRSSDFGKIKIGNTRYDIWGGFQQYIRVLAQVFTASAKSTNTGKIYELSGKGAFGKTRADVLETFGRNKLSPLPSMALDFATGRTSQGEKVTVSDELQQHFLPLLYSDIKDAMQSGDVKSAILPAAASTFGVGVQTYKTKPKKSTQSKISLQ